MYSEALKQIREARSGGAVSGSAYGPHASASEAAQGGLPPKRGRRKQTPEERRAFYERQGWLLAVSPEVASVAGSTESGESGQPRQE